ncbi:MAG: sigma-70 family RNA polymerase sigma factor [Synergistaceae bacterium]|nr:sigma-70 family RNA polymerase sigma factor [Synergistaceae bacterium]
MLEDKSSQISSNKDEAIDGIDALVEAFTPLVRSVARRYEGRGALREDLEQEGYLALLKIARRASQRGRLSRVLWNFLPAMVRDAAAKMRWGVRDVPLSPGGEYGDPDDEGDPPAVNVACERASRDYDEVELRAAIDALGEAPDRDIAGALADGLNLGEIAAMLHIDRKTLRKRIRGLCDKLGRYLRDYDRS